jgi:hypothetical protein
MPLKAEHAVLYLSSQRVSCRAPYVLEFNSTSHNNEPLDPADYLCFPIFIISALFLGVVGILMVILRVLGCGGGGGGGRKRRSVKGKEREVGGQQQQQQQQQEEQEEKKKSLLDFGVAGIFTEGLRLRTTVWVSE